MAGGFEKVKRPDGIRIKIVERNRGGAIVRRLGGCVNYGGGLDRLNQCEHPGAVANIEFVVNEAGDGGGKTALVPAGISLRAEEYGTLVVVQAMDGVAEFA